MKKWKSRVVGSLVKMLKVVLEVVVLALVSIAIGIGILICLKALFPILFLGNTKNMTQITLGLIIPFVIMAIYRKTRSNKQIQ